MDIKDLEALKTANGGFTKETLEMFGEPWPPKKGWKKRLLRKCKIWPSEYRERQKKQNRKKKKEQNTARKGFYQTFEWARIRYNALKRNNGQCECCGRGKVDGVVLHVDHIKPIKRFPKLRANPANLQVLCATCNWGKGNRDTTDWREPSLRVLMGEDMA